MPTMEWRNYFNKWKFIYRQQPKQERIANYFRAFLVNKFAARIFTTKPDNSNDRMWQRVYIAEGDIAFQRMKIVEEIIQNTQPRFSSYKKRLMTTIETRSRPDYLFTREEESKTVFPKELIQCIFSNPLVNPFPAPSPEIDPRQARQIEQKREQIFNAIKDHLLCKALTELKSQKEAAIAALTEVDANPLQRELKTIKQDLDAIKVRSHCSFYCDPMSRFAGYAAVFKNEVQPPPRFRNVIGWNLIYPFYLADALVGALSFALAHIPCMILNFLTCGCQNSLPVVILKGLIVSPFVAIDFTTFALTKLFSGSGVLAETIKCCRALSSASVASTPIVGSPNGTTVDLPHEPSISGVVVLSTSAASAGEKLYKVPSGAIAIRVKGMDESPIDEPKVAAIETKVAEMKVKKLRRIRKRSCSVTGSQFFQPAALTRRRYSLGDAPINWGELADKQKILEGEAGSKEERKELSRSMTAHR